MNTEIVAEGWDLLTVTAWVLGIAAVLLFGVVLYGLKLYRQAMEEADPQTNQDYLDQGE